MVDEIDRAEEMIAMERASAVDAVRQRAAQLGVTSGATHCRRCGDLIPAGRRSAIPAARHCIACASEGAP